MQCFDRADPTSKNFTLEQEKKQSSCVSAKSGSVGREKQEDQERNVDIVDQCPLRTMSV